MVSKEKESAFSKFMKDDFGRTLVTIFGLSMIGITLLIGAFLFYKGTTTFTEHGHSIFEFIFSSEWAPTDDPVAKGGGKIGSAIYIWGSISTCALALLIATPFSLAAAIFLSEVAGKTSVNIVRPAVEIFVGIPSVIYGWVGYQILVSGIRAIFPDRTGDSVLAAGIVLAIMIFPTITTVATDAMKAVPIDYRSGAYGLGSTRWQVIRKIVLPAATPGILTGIILGLARAFGEALAVGMVIGKARMFPADILSPTYNLTTAISAQMNDSSDGSELNAALWTMALFLFVVSIICIIVIHEIKRKVAIEE